MAVHLAADVDGVAVVAVRRVLLAVGVTGQRRRPPPLLWRRVFGAMIFFCMFLAGALLASRCLLLFLSG